MRDDFFGGLFDLDGDGVTDSTKEALGFAMISELLDDGNDDLDSDLDDLDDLDFGLEDEDDDESDF